MVRGLAFFAAALLVVGCGDDSGEPAVPDGSETGTNPTTGGEADTDEPDPGTTSTTSSNDTGDTTEGGPEICGIDEGDAPAFTMSQGGVEVPATDASIEVSCGGQGAFMFYFPVTIIGVDPGSDDQVPFAVTMDVDGMEAYEGEHFIDRNMFLYVGCDDPLDGPNPSSFNLVIPDQISSTPEALDGLTFAMEVVMMPGSSQEVGFSTEGVIVATEDEGAWDWCFPFGETEGDTEGDTDGTTGGTTGGDTDGTTGTTG